MKRKGAAAAAAAVLLVLGYTSAAQPTASQQTARRGADDAEQGGHRGDHHDRGTVPAAPAADPPGEKGKALFEEKCAICHELSRPLDRRKNRAGWTDTVKRMQEVNGCPITDAEAQEIIDYLVKVRG